MKLSRLLLIFPQRSDRIEGENVAQISKNFGWFFLRSFHNRKINRPVSEMQSIWGDTSGSVHPNREVDQSLSNSRENYIRIWKELIEEIISQYPSYLKFTFVDSCRHPLFGNAGLRETSRLALRGAILLPSSPCTSCLAYAISQWIQFGRTKYQEDRISGKDKSFVSSVLTDAPAVGQCLHSRLFVL